MSTQIIECCHNCANCNVSKKICTLHNKNILNVNTEKCFSYIQRCLKKCELCGDYVINLAVHVNSMHKLTLKAYNIKTQLNETDHVHVKEGRLF